MKLNEGVELAVHICSLLGYLPGGQSLPVPRLAEYFELPEAYLAKVLRKLSHAGLVETKTGPRGGYALAYKPDDLSLLKIVQAVDGKDPFFRCTEIRQNGPTKVARKHFTRPCSIARSMWKAEQAWRSQLSDITLKDIQTMGANETCPEQLEKAAHWLREVLQ